MNVSKGFKVVLLVFFTGLLAYIAMYPSHPPSPLLDGHAYHPEFESLRSTYTLVDLSNPHAPDLIKQARDSFNDPDAVKFGALSADAKGEILCGYVNAKNAYGAYTGKQYFAYGPSFGFIATGRPSHQVCARYKLSVVSQTPLSPEEAEIEASYTDNENVGGREHVHILMEAVRHHYSDGDTIIFTDLFTDEKGTVLCGAMAVKVQDGGDFDEMHTFAVSDATGVVAYDYAAVDHLCKGHKVRRVYRGINRLTLSLGWGERQQ